MMRNQQRTKY